MPRRYAAPHVDECYLCDQILNGPLTKTRKGWAHKACLQREQQ